MHQGLFSYLNNGGEVKNLSISGTVTAKSNVGSIVGYNGGNIENCFSDVTVTGTGTYIGGIAGYNSDGTIKNCVNVGKVSGSGMLGSIVGGVSVWYVNNNCYYLKGTATNGVGGGTGGGGDRGISARTVDEFKSGYIAYSLQNKQSDSSKQAWGQTISGANKDDYPVLTSDAAKKVYRIRFMANNEGEGNYNTHSTAYSNNGGTVALPSHTSDKFRGWSERVNGSKLSGGFVTATNADKDFYSLWKVGVTFKVSDTNYVYKMDTPREITVDPSITAIPKSDISVKYYTVDENDGNLKSTTPIQSAITVGKYLYVIDITGSSADEYYIKRKYAAANTNLPNLSEFDNIGYMYISATTEQQDVFSIEDIPESVYYGDSFTVSPYGASGTVTYEITDGADIASIDKTSGKVTVTGVGKVTIRAKSVLDGYEDRYAVRSFAAKKRVLTPTVTADDRQYNGENGVSVSISLDNIANNDGISAAASGSMINADAGDGKIVYVSGVALSGDKKDLYTLSSTTLQTTVNITPIDILSFTISAADKKYDGTTNASATVTDISGVLDKDKSQVQIVGSAEFDSADSADGKTVTYTAHGLSGSKAANYTLSAANAAASANIKPLNIDFVIGQTSFVYDGTDKNINVSASDENGRIFKDYQISYTDESGTAAVPKEAGNYTAKITLNDTTNYTTMQSDIPVTVAKAAQNSLVIAGLPGTVRYGDSFDMEAVGGADGGTYEWTVNNASFTPILSGADKNVDVKYALITDGSVTEPKNAGTYAVSFTVTDESFSGGGNATLYINKANIAVKAKDISKEYGEDPIYELEIIGGDSNAATAEEFMNYVTFTSDGADKKANVNTYDINVSLTSDGDANRSLTVSDQKGLMTVTKAPLTIKVKDVTREYGAANPTLEAEYIGFKNDETKDVLTGELVLDYDESINEQTPIGEYPDKTTASGVDAANYAITFEQGKVTITKIGVNASAGTARPSYINVNFDKALEGLTADNFVIKNGEETVTPTDITASNDNKTYTLNGSFSTSVTYIITPNLTGTAADNTYEIISGSISVRPSSGGSSGGGGGGGGAAAYFTVSFETNGGSKIDSITVARNKTAAEPAKPVKDGFTFDGWYADKELKTVYDFAQKVTKNITLYAKWTAEDTKPDKPSGGSDGSEWKNPFVDVSKDDWFYDDVKYVNKNGLMNGTSSTTFEPNSPLTRDMFVTILWRAEGKPQTNYAMTFNDVPANTYYTEAVRWAASEKIVKGYSETEFGPSDKITREQIAAIIHRYAGYKGYNVSVGDNTDVLAYADYKDISDWALESVIFCKQNGIMKGNDLNEFKPLDSTLRSEAAAIIRRFIEIK